MKDYKKYFFSELKRKILFHKNESINEAINFDLECIFIAIPKTGSTSVRSQIRQKKNNSPYVSNPHLNIIQIRDLIYPFLLKKKPWRK